MVYQYVLNLAISFVRVANNLNLFQKTTTTHEVNKSYEPIESHKNLPITEMTLGTPSTNVK